VKRHEFAAIADGFRGDPTQPRLELKLSNSVTTSIIPPLRSSCVIMFARSVNDKDARAQDVASCAALVETRQLVQMPKWLPAWLDLPGTDFKGQS
jgi:hypothetical protein